MDESMQIMKHEFGWKVKPQKGHKLNSSGKKRDSLEDLEFMADHNDLVTWDLELYRYAMYLNTRQLQQIKKRRDYRKLVQIRLFGFQSFRVQTWPINVENKFIFVESKMEEK